MTSSSRGAVAVSLGLKDASESVLFWDIATAGEQDPKFGDSENTQSTKTPCFSTEVYYHQVFSQNALLLKPWKFRSYTYTFKLDSYAGLKYMDKRFQ
ncbi:hypothetical protein JL09_g5777 [Pichia kudriavzevii]|uniref:Uncharacterized protein n=1 Tax=Pichia kudriavzevii TaxID=4909 RepID=A0A099NQM9_PICKU|nr:hypothetical protein JL09_g5777 [Pichia kudriavzevii]